MATERTGATPHAAPTGPARARCLVFAMTSVALTLSAIDGTVVATALPTLTREVSASVTWSAWTITAYSLGIITGLPIAGRLSDLLGRKRMFLGFISLFTVASLRCGHVGNIFALVGLRFVQALGGAGLMPSTAGVLSDQFGSARDRPIGLMTSIFPLGAMIGPALGGLIVTYSSWRLIFFINVPLGIALLLTLSRLLPPDLPLGGGRLRIDRVGSGLMILAIVSFMLGLNALGELSPRSALPWVLLGMAALSDLDSWPGRRVPGTRSFPRISSNRRSLRSSTGSTSSTGRRPWDCSAWFRCTRR